MAGGGEAGFDIAGHDGTDGDAEGLDLIGKRHCVRIDRRLTGGVIGLERNGHRCRDRAEINDTPAALLAHQRQDSMVHAHHAEEIDIEKAADIGGIGELHCAGNAEAGIVDENIDPAVFRHHLPNGSGNLCFIGDITFDMGNAGNLAVTAAQLVDLAAPIPQGSGGAKPDAAAAAGDYNDLIHAFSPNTLPMISTASSMSGSVRVAI